MSGIRNIIFDWSGTLVDDLPATVTSMNHALGPHVTQPYSVESFREDFFLPYPEFYKTVAPGISLEVLERMFHEKFEELHAGVLMLPHATEFLEFCATHGWRCLVLTSLRSDRFEEQAERLGVRRFFEIVYAGIKDKRHVIGEILTSNELVASETLYVGDMVHDIETARFGGVRSCAVLTGYTGMRQLSSSRPDWMVEHLAELRSLVEEGIVPAQLRAEVPAVVVKRPIVTVGALIRNEQGQWLVVRTRKWSETWGMPGGKVRHGERVEEAVVREMREETGLDVRIVRLLEVQDCINPAEFYRPVHFVLLCFEVVCCGGHEVRLNAEASAYRWVSSAEMDFSEMNTPTRLAFGRLFGE